MALGCKASSDKSQTGGDMTTSDLEQSLERLLADPRLVELSELQRTGDEVLDVISLTENQHSDILAWMLDAKEGHGQGDEILRDLLICASTTAASASGGLDGRGSTAKFFAKWTPSRIRTASFGAAFVARELGMKASERVDLFVIDAQNRFILVIENKAGAAHGEAQLNLYRKRYDEMVVDNPRLSEYEHVFIALDRDYDADSTEPRPASSWWLHLGYDWLTTSATRALMHVARGNAAARLVVSYCNRQTSWEGPHDEKCLSLAAALHRSHPEAVKYLIGSTRGRLEGEWLRQRKDQWHLLFRLQNKSAVAMLKEADGMASLKVAIQEKLPSLPRDNIEFWRARLEICPTGWEKFMADVWWPVYMSIKYAENPTAKYSLSLIWARKHAGTNAEAEALRRRVIAVDPRFEKYGESDWRVVKIEHSLTQSELLARVAALDKQLTDALSG